MLVTIFSPLLRRAGLLKDLCSCPSWRGMLDFLKAREDVGKRGAKMTRALLRICNFFFLSFSLLSLLFILHQGLRIKSQTVLSMSFSSLGERGQGSWGPQLLVHVGGRGRCAGINTCIAEGHLGQQLGDQLQRISVTFGADSGSSLLIISLGKPPGDYQEALHPVFLQEW